MEDSWHQLKPKTGFTVRVNGRISDLSWQTLTQLYQPIMGPSAVGLFSALFWLPSPGTYQRHTTLLAVLGLDLEHFYDARIRLEATGLLTTKVTTQDELTGFVYELHAPLAPAAFFKDDLLSVQLLGVVGEEMYQQLVTTNVPRLATMPNEKDITKNFLEVFHVDGQELNELPAAITTGRQRLTEATPTPVLSTDTEPGFDFKLLGEILEHSFIDTRAVQANRQLLLTEHVTYGLDEVTMARYVGEATDLATNKFDTETFKRIVAQHFGQPRRTTVPITDKSKPVESTIGTTTSAEQALIKVATTTAPAVFLQAIKQKNGGFVTDGEQRIVRDLVSRQLFSEAVLNLMIYHVLVDEDKPTLNKNLLDTIANDWSKAKVDTPQLAIQKIRERQRAASQPRKSRNRQPTVKETLPDWAKKPAAAATTSTAKLSTEQQQRLQERIAKLKENRESGKED
ncbi:replication initiation and membrane attachment family protein [Levilactobacillus fujinensis]|uniref:Replication initiation and membrane attachment family protein n=1 Tax=Levilactobacillus fujinensis TaxID=2486024 RepID=A0ABW1TCQ4_9LACO|nr:DnaD domain protein [Levilactobacillus fujinensis]